MISGQSVRSCRCWGSLPDRTEPGDGAAELFYARFMAVPGIMASSLWQRHARQTSASLPGRSRMLVISVEPRFFPGRNSCNCPVQPKCAAMLRESSPTPLPAGSDPQSLPFILPGPPVMGYRSHASFLVMPVAIPSLSKSMWPPHPSTTTTSVTPEAGTFFNFR